MEFLSRFLERRRQKKFYRDLGVPEENIELALDEERRQAERGPTLQTLLAGALGAEKHSEPPPRGRQSGVKPQIGNPEGGNWHLRFATYSTATESEITEWIRTNAHGDAYISPTFDSIEGNQRRRAFYFRNAHDLAVFDVFWKKRSNLK